MKKIDEILTENINSHSYCWTCETGRGLCRELYGAL